VITTALLALSLSALPMTRVTTFGPKVATVAHLSFEQLSRAADRARDENRDDDAIRLYKDALAQRAEWRQGLWYLGTLLYEKEQYADARDTFRRFLTLRPDAGPGWALLGICEFQMREYPRALDHLQRAMAQGMGGEKDLRQSVFYHVAILLTRLERYDDSMDMLLRMLATDSDAASLVKAAGLAGLRLPLLPTEIGADRRQLIDLAGQGVVALQTQHYEDAEAKFKAMVAAYPNESGVHFLYGVYLMQLHPEDGIREMKRELEISPFHVLARVRLAQQYIELQQFDQALISAREAVKFDPKRASAHMLLGEVLMAKGQSGDGIKELEMARDNDPLVARTHWDLLRAYTAAGRAEDARREKEMIEKLSGTASGASAQDGSSSEPESK